MVEDGSGALAWTEERLRSAADAAGMALWSWNIDTDQLALDERAYRLWGVPAGSRVTFRDLSERIHPVDVDRVGRAFKAVRSKDGPFEIDFCILDNDAHRWISARGHGGPAGMVDRITFATFMDITARKQAEETREMLIGEMSHRVKNLFAITSALTSIAAHSAATATEMAADLTLRLDALGQAHDLVLPSSGEGAGKTATLDELLTILLAPYDDRAAPGSRIRLTLPDLLVGEIAITTLALVVHELATNSIKYGALATPSGLLDVSCTSQDGAVVLVWTEQGGPVVRAPIKQGFGSSLVMRSMSGQLGGSIAYDWRAEGMIATLRMNRDKLAT